MKKILLTYYYVFLEEHTKKDKVSPYWFTAFAQVTITLLLFFVPIIFFVEDLLNFKMNMLVSMFFLGVIPAYLIYLLLFDILKFDKIFNEDKKKELSITKKTKYVAYFVYFFSFIYLLASMYIFYPPKQ